MALMRPNPLDVLATPTDVFLQLRERPQWLLAFLLITAITLSVAYLTIPFAQRVMYLTLSQRMDADQLSKASVFLHRAALLGLAAVPLVLLFRWLILGTVFYAASTLLGAEELRFKVVYAVVVYSELVLLLMAVINILLLQPETCVKKG